jgi:hypothetical protein
MFKNLVNSNNSVENSNENNIILENIEETAIYFISHASVVIRYGEYILVTDPYFITPAFTTWKTSPCATMSLDALISLSYSKKLAFVISHSHEDHYDINFLKKCYSETPVFICKFPKDDFKTSLLKDCNLVNITEIVSYELTPTKWGPFEMNAWLDPGSDFDSVISIASPDSFIFHGNDCWGITNEIQGSSIMNVKNRYSDRKSLFMGQGGTASGWPLNYFCYSETEKIKLLEKKVENMVKTIAESCKTYNFDRALAYAMLTRIDIPEKNYSFQTQTMTGNYANFITSSNLFINLHPGDVYIPKEMRVIKILGTLDHLKLFTNNMGTSPHFGKELTKSEWFELGYHQICENFVKKIIPQQIKSELDKDDDEKFPQHKTEEGKWVENDFDLIFKLIITDNYKNNTVIDEISISMFEATREKILRVPGNIMALVCKGNIPFRDLYIGYLGEFSRKPRNIYNKHFFQALIKSAGSYFKSINK